jgi:hypothetical protein
MTSNDKKLNTTIYTKIKFKRLIERKWICTVCTMYRLMQSRSSKNRQVQIILIPRIGNLLKQCGLKVFVANTVTSVPDPYCVTDPDPDH